MKRALAAAALAACFSFESAALIRKGPVGPEAEQGRREAERDIRQGKLILRSYGLVATSSQYSHLLFERLGVRTEAVAGCIVDGAIVARTAGYNEVMKSEIEKRFGSGILEDIARVAR